MFGYKDPTRTIPVIDDRTSLVDAKQDETERSLHSLDMLAEARQQLAERLKPEVSNISARALDEASLETRERVITIASNVIDAMQQRGLTGRGPIIDDDQAQVLLQQLLDWQFGTGPLEPLFREPDVEDIVINAVEGESGKPRLDIWTYRQSGKQREAITLTPDELREIINRNAGYQGRALNPTTPILNAQMRGSGSRINAVLSPVCDPHISVTIRIHRLIARSFDDLVRLGTLSVPAANWLWLAVQSGLSTIVAGATSSGKTNFLNALAGVMPSDLRCVVIEDTRELALPVRDKVYLLTTQNADGVRTITQRHLVANALRMRPDRIILGEVRDAAAWDAVKACNTGHEGTLLTVHAEDAPGTLIRLAQLCGEATETSNFPDKTLREVIASAFQCVVFLERRRQPDGSFKRFVTQINEVNGHVVDSVTVQKPLFQFEDGQLHWTRQWPHERIKRRVHDAGFDDNDIESALTGAGRMWVQPF